MTLRAQGGDGTVSRGDRNATRSRRLQRPARGGAGRAAAGRLRRAGPVLAIALGLGAASGAAPGAAPGPGASGPTPVPSLAPPFAHSPLPTPLVLNGGFGEYRSNHFHAGLDLGTGLRVGRPVFAPLAGWIERVRASGVGYGRSIYLHAADGRLIVFAHLDAFAPALAAYVAAAQESTGQYEQDLWPEPGRFRVAAGERIGWSGESGSGGPHLHVEVRRGDMAYHPLRTGMAIPDTSAPTLASVTLEPLDDTSYVEGSAAPVTVRLGARADTVRMVGRARAVVAARDGVWRGVDRMVPWSVALAFAGTEVECRYDSVSWATDMSESDHVYDSGRVVGERGMVMWAPGGFRPRILRASAAGHDEAGTLRVRPGDPPRTLRLVARDLAGRVCERELVLAPPAPGAGGPDTSRAGGRALADSTRAFDLALLPGGRLRVTFRGAPAGSRGVTIAGRPASLRDGEWTAVVALPRSGRDGPLDLWAAGRDATGRGWRTPLRVSIRQDPTRRTGSPSEAAAIEWTVPRGGQFEPGPLLHRTGAAPPAAPAELAARSEVLEVLPATLRLRRPLRLEWRPPAAPGANVGLYGDDGDGWSWINSPLDSALGRRAGETRHLGRFALFADTVAPRIAAPPAPGRALKGPYSRWALEARVREEGSGVDARGSWFEVDGRRVPAEWDGDQGILRWRPARPPRRGEHRYVVVARDRAGNERRLAGRFAMR